MSLLPARMHTTQSQYDTPHPALSLLSRSIAPALFRGQLAPVPPPISGAKRPRTPATKKLVRCLLVACLLLVVSVTAPLRSLYIGCLSSCSLLARCLLVAADTSGGLGRECVPVGAVAPTDTHPRPNSALRCFLSERFNSPEASSRLAAAAQKKNNKKIMIP